MLNCRDCEFCKVGTDGHLAFACDPFSNVKEPECINKWLLLKLNMMVGAYQATLSYYRRLAPLQERMFKHVERELVLNERQQFIELSLPAPVFAARRRL